MLNITPANTYRLSIPYFSAKILETASQFLSHKLNNKFYVIPQAIANEAVWKLVAGKKIHRLENMEFILFQRRRAENAWNSQQVSNEFMRSHATIAAECTLVAYRQQWFHQRCRDAR